MDLPDPFPDWPDVPPEAEGEHLHGRPAPLSGEQSAPDPSCEGLQNDGGIVRKYLPDGRLHMLTDAYGRTTVFCDDSDEKPSAHEPRRKRQAVTEVRTVAFRRLYESDEQQHALERAIRAGGHWERCSSCGRPNFVVPGYPVACPTCAESQ